MLYKKSNITQAKTIFTRQKKAPRRGFVKTQTLFQRGLANDEVSQQDMHAILLSNFS